MLFLLVSGFNEYFNGFELHVRCEDAAGHFIFCRKEISLLTEMQRQNLFKNFCSISDCRISPAGKLSFLQYLQR